MQSVLIIPCFICKVSLLFSALYANCLYYSVLYMQSVLIIQCFICKVFLSFGLLYSNCPYHSTLANLQESSPYSQAEQVEPGPLEKEGSRAGAPSCRLRPTLAGVSTAGRRGPQQPAHPGGLGTVLQVRDRLAWSYRELVWDVSTNCNLCTRSLLCVENARLTNWTDYVFNTMSPQELIFQKGHIAYKVLTRKDTSHIKHYIIRTLCM